MLLATYGTLRKGEYMYDFIRLIEQAAREFYLETIEVSGLKIFIMGTVPGAKLTNNPEDKAVIDLIEADLSKENEEAVKQLLDRVEGVADGLYERNYLTTPKGKALIYTVCGNIGRHTSIRDWKEWKKRNKKERRRDMRNAGNRSIGIKQLT